MKKTGATRNKPRPNFSAAEDAVIINETAARKAYHETAQFENVAKTLNSSPACLGAASARSVLIRFSRLLKTWRANYGRLRSKSSIDEEFTAIDELLANISADIQDVEDEKAAIRLQEKQKK